MNGTALCKRNNATKFGLKGLCLEINHTCVLEIMAGLIILSRCSRENKKQQTNSDSTIFNRFQCASLWAQYTHL